MRSQLIVMVTAVASILLVAQVSAADPVQDQFRLMEQRMAEMEDRLAATSNKLDAAETKLDQRDAQLQEHGLLDEGDSSLRSGVGRFFEMVDFSGVIAASYNHRLKDDSVEGDLAGGNALFRHPDANTFALDQFWLIVDKTPTEESRGGFHVEFVTGQSGFARGQDSTDEPYFYSGYVSYLAPIGNGVQVDAGRLTTPLGAEGMQTDKNFNITQGLVFNLRPVNHTGVSVSTPLTDELGIILGAVNEVYSDTFTSEDNDKAFYGQLVYAQDNWGLKVGAIVGDDTGGDPCGAATDLAGNSLGRSDCKSSVLDVVLSMDPTDDLSLWVNYDWAHSGGQDYLGHGDAHGIAAAGRLAVTETVGVASRVEYVWKEDSLARSPDDLTARASDDSEQISLTATVDKELAEGLVTRFEVRWDHSLEQVDFPSDDSDQVVALAEIYYSF